MYININSSNSDNEKIKSKDMKAENYGCYPDHESDCGCKPHFEKKCKCECNCNCNGGGGTASALCIATGAVDVQTGGSALVNIPPNACITKIYASFRPGVDINTFADVLILPNGPDATSILFQTFFESSPNHGSFETTLVQPLCVGPEGAVARVDGEISTTIVSITVIYCLECCTPPLLE